MPGKSDIGWTERTWNPMLGCTPVSEGCRHCYAERVAHGLESKGVEGYYGTTRLNKHGVPKWTGKVNIVEGRLDQPIRWKKPSLIFVNSMSDLFHESLSKNDIRRVFDVMAEADHHQFQVLTKRPKRAFLMDLEYPKNVWMGVSIENCKVIPERMKYLEKLDANIRFLSCEPMLESIAWDLCEYLKERWVNWVIVGGESGPGARPMEYKWVEFMHTVCDMCDTPFFFKQWGGEKNKRVEPFVLKGRGGDPDRVIDNEYPKTWLWDWMKQKPENEQLTML